MEGYCQQCIYTDREKPHKEFINYDILIYCKKLKKMFLVMVKKFVLQKIEIGNI